MHIELTFTDTLQDLNHNALEIRLARTRQLLHTGQVLVHGNDLIHVGDELATACVRGGCDGVGKLHYTRRPRRCALAQPSTPHIRHILKLLERAFTTEVFGQSEVVEVLSIGVLIRRFHQRACAHSGRAYANGSEHRAEAGECHPRPQRLHNTIEDSHRQVHLVELCHLAEVGTRLSNG